MKNGPNYLQERPSELRRQVSHKSLAEFAFFLASNGTALFSLQIKHNLAKRMVVGSELFVHYVVFESRFLRLRNYFRHLISQWSHVNRMNVEFGVFVLRLVAQQAIFGRVFLQRSLKIGSFLGGRSRRQVSTSDVVVSLPRIYCS
jgi:hypothetical protein